MTVIVLPCVIEGHESPFILRGSPALPFALALRNGIVTLIAGLRPPCPSASQVDEHTQLFQLPVSA